jgi:hypothetical protein
MRAGAALVATTIAGCAAAVSNGKLLTPDERMANLRRAQVWAPTDIPSMDMTRGPEGGFAAGTDVECDYRDIKYGGNSPKFGCEPVGKNEAKAKEDQAGKAPGKSEEKTGDQAQAKEAKSDDKAEKDALKVRYGNDNGEIYAGVASTRLLWALGFGADGLYPVHVICRHCPAMTDGQDLRDGRERFDVAAIELPFAGHKIDAEGAQDGWPWSDLDMVQPGVGGAPRAQRDALKLLAVLLQHTDNKAEQQRLICRSKGHSRDELVNCPDPFMLIHDVGMTFGRANWANSQPDGSTSFALWSKTPIWKDRAKCVGNLYGSHTGTLHDPPISEEGRAFLSGLLNQLTDTQLHDLFTVAMFDRKPRGGAPIDAWVTAFKQKRAEIASLKCPS